MTRFDTDGFFIGSNWLHSPPPDGKLLKVAAMEGLDDKRWEIQADELAELIHAKIGMFSLSMETFYQESLRINAGKGLTIGRPSIWLAQLGTATQSDTRWNQVFTEKGFNNGGIIKNIDEIKEPYHPYWNAVIDGSQGVMLPEVRRVSGRALGGAWLLLELDEPRLEDETF